MSEEVGSELLALARAPAIEYGRGLLNGRSSKWGEYVLLTMPEVWEAARPLLAKKPSHVHFIESMDRAEAGRAEASLPGADNYVGIGGGMAMDMAKYVGWKRGVRPILAPSIASADACVTNTIAVRDDNRVRYIGFTAAKEVDVDFGLVGSAPPRLNRAGIGDILSIHTGRFDWRLAAAAGEAELIDDIHAEVGEMVGRMRELAGEIREVSDRAVRFLIDTYSRINALCLDAGHSRPEEGSEHFFAYNVERLTGRPFVHGELVCLGVVLLSRLQDNEPEMAMDIIEAAGVRWQPRDLGLSREEVGRALGGLREYASAEGLYYSILNERDIGGQALAAMIEGLVFESRA